MAKKPEDIWFGNKTNGIEVRHHADGSIDEVCLWVDGKCVMHMEQMGDNHFWIGLYSKNHAAHLNLGAFLFDPVTSQNVSSTKAFQPDHD